MSRIRWIIAVLAAVAFAAAPVAHAQTDDAPDAVPAILDLTGWTDLTVPADLSAPETAVDVGPGSHLIIDIPDEGTFGCTANFVWTDGSTQYLGAAGHCFLPADRTADAGEGADYDTSGVTVRACASECTNGGFSGFLIEGTTVELGTVAYARQTGDGGDVGNDFGIVEIPAGVAVRTTMPVFDGPTRADGTLTVGDAVCFYGNGVGVGEVFPTMGRTGLGLFEDAGAFFFESAGAPGDSGSAVQTCVPTAEDGLAGDAAIGIFTHLTSIGLAGTTDDQAVAMTARDTGINLELVLDGGAGGDTGGDSGGGDSGDGGDPNDGGNGHGKGKDKDKDKDRGRPEGKGPKA